MLAGLCGSAALAWVAWTHLGAKAQEITPAAGPTAAPAPEIPARKVRLRFFNQSWPDVLRIFAASTRSVLVMDEEPRGRYTRNDFRLYSRAEAVRILNQELEAQGFRLVEKGNHLVLLQVNDVRAEYGLPQLPASTSAAPSGSPSGPPATGPEADQPQAGAPDGDAQEPAAAPPATRTRSDAAPQSLEAFSITPATGDTGAFRELDGNPPPAGGASQQAADTGQRNRQRPGAVQTRVDIQSKDAADVARIIHAAYREVSELSDAGPAGLPALVVYRDRGEEEPRSRIVDFALGIDTQRDQLVVESGADRATQIAQLIRILDTPRPKDTTAQLFPLEDANADLAATMQTLANHAVQSDRMAQLPPVQQRGPVMRLAQQPPQPGAAPQPPAGQPPANAQPPELPNQPPGDQPDQVPPETPLPGQQVPPNLQPMGPPIQLDLLGPVTVQDVPGVGLVVSGNEEDVQAVIAAVRALTRMGEGAAADVHLLMLLHVNSQALAELLNSVYQALTEIRRPLAGDLAQTVRVIPVVKPNAILILAPDYEMDSVRELAERLDQPVPPEAEFEIFRLRSAVADQVVTAIQTFYEERPPLGTRVVAIADVRTNSVIVQARGHDMAEVARLIRSLDVEGSEAVSRMRVFTLTHATANELASVINAAIQGVLQPPSPLGAGFGQVPGAGAGFGAGGEVPEGLRTAKSMILELIAAEGEVDQMVRSGILSDIRVTADPARNSLIVTAPPASMDLMAALIAALDRPTPLVADVKVFTLANSDATVTAELLQTLFEPQPVTGQQPGVQIAGADGAGAGVIPLRFSVDRRTNSIIATGTPEMLNIVYAILLRLDASDIRQRRNVVIKLQNAPVSEVGLALNQFLTAQRELAAVDPDLVTSLELLQREIIVVPEIVTNSLLISATPHYFDDILEMVRQLDRKPPEVVIQALLVEVELNNTDEFGVEIGAQDPILFDRSEDGEPGFNFNNQTLGNNVTASPNTIGTQGLTDLGLVRINPDLGFGGLVISASSDYLNVLIRALSAKRSVQILSRPTIRTLDNQPALIQVGQQVPIITGANVGQFAVTPIIQQQQIGIILTVTPRISPDGTIVMETIATKSSLSPQGVPIFSDADTVIESPVVDITTAQATISVPNGQTVVLGGMITKTDGAFERKVPWIGDVPYVGSLFRYDQVETRRTELLIFLTPRVIRNDADSELIKRVEAERLHFIEKDAESVHGPLYSAPMAPGEGLPLPSDTPAGPVPGAGMPGPVPGAGMPAPVDVLPAPDFPVTPIPQGSMESRQEQAVGGPIDVGLEPEPPGTPGSIIVPPNNAAPNGPNAVGTGTRP